MRTNNNCEFKEIQERYACNSIDGSNCSQRWQRKEEYEGGSRWMVTPFGSIIKE